LTKDEALKLALEALENLYDTCDWHGDDGKEAMVNAPKAIAAIKDTLAQPAQGLVAWGVFEGNNLHDMFFTSEEAQELAELKGSHAKVRPLYDALLQEPHNFCPRCGKRTPDLTTIHTCTPPKGGC